MANLSLLLLLVIFTIFSTSPFLSCYAAKPAPAPGPGPGSLEDAAKFKFKIIFPWQVVRTHHMHIVNNLPKSSGNLKLHCKSEEDDLGVHHLRKGGEFTWKFRTNILETTTYKCQFYLQGKDRSFDVFNARENYPTCATIEHNTKHCYWSVQDTGFYYAGYNAKLNSKDWIIQHYWDKQALN